MHPEAVLTLALLPPRAAHLGRGGVRARVEVGVRNRVGVRVRGEFKGWASSWRGRPV